ncbi:hypothetical protein V6Z12_A05G085400 [Gossypium hirsutum]
MEGLLQAGSSYFYYKYRQSWIICINIVLKVD